MKKTITILLCLFLSVFLFAQENKVKKDSIKQLDEITITGRRKLSNYRQSKTLSSIDSYLENSSKISMIKRGNYAWEPSLNSMTTDRLNVTIDGMQIYGACTDKMDPTTSYVDVSNLEKVTINSGQDGTENGNSIGGSIDLKLPKAKYYNTGLKTSVDLGYETNGNYKSTGLDIEYSGNKFFISADGIFRKSDNYNAGKNQEILYSQFQKYNVSLQTGYKLSDKHNFEINILYDKATDVGYPALPMDVSLAEATIASFSHHFKNDSLAINNWETKLYFNTITHTMDDTKRPIVPIRMDMPGWSDTYGMYSKINFQVKKHNFLINLSSHYNKSLAEMTMYPNDPSENEMFMYTWPDVKTFNLGVYIKDDLQLSNTSRLSISSRFAHHNNRIDNKIGLQSLQIYYPNMKQSKNRFLSSFSTKYSFNKTNYDISVGLGYGERAPSISEGYGFYLFNSFDKYDYIGNPLLENEKAIDVNFKMNYKKKRYKIGLETSYFKIYDYIIGEIDASLVAMTIGANGVRIYNALDNASIFNTSLSGKFNISKSLTFNANIGYSYGVGSNKESLPLISPFSYFSELNYQYKNAIASVQVKGNGNQTNYSHNYGEDETPSYNIINLNLGNKFSLKENSLVVKTGVENVLDKTYSTFSDWNNFPRQGRNFYINVSYLMN